MVDPWKPESHDGCDSFDDDLAWILDKLTERSGGHLGVIVRFVEGIEAGALMARTSGAAALPEGSIDQLKAELRRSLALRTTSDRQELSASRTFRLAGVPDALRLIYLSFEPAPGVCIVAAVGRGESSSSLLQNLVARRLHPVLERYVRLWWMHRTERRRARALESAVELAELGMLLLDRRGQLLYENAYARRILDAADGIRRSSRSLVASNPADAVRLQAAIHHALVGNLAQDPYACWQAPLVQLRRGENARALILTAMSHRGRAVDPDDAAVIVYVLHPECDLRQSLVPACRIYGLTAAEGRLVNGLVRGASLPEVADELHISLATVRAQLKHVFGKTRTNRQSELVRVMLASAVRSSVSVDLTLT